MAAALAVDPNDPPPGLTTEASFRLPAGVVEVDDIVYGYGDGVPLSMNVIRPKIPPPGRIPALVWIHGGGWHAGNRYSGRFESAYMAQRGYFCVSIDYRLSQDFVWPAQIHDCKAAVRYLRANAAKYGIDPKSIGVWGDSAGGHLAALLGTTGDIKELEGAGGHGDKSSKVQAVCDWYGPTNIALMQEQGSDLSPDDPFSAPALLFGSGGLKRHSAAIRQADPCTHVSQSSAPFLVIHGDADTSVPLAQSKLLVNSLQALGKEAELVVLPGAVHGDSAFHSARVMNKCASFFDKHLKLQTPSAKDIGTPASTSKGYTK